MNQKAASEMFWIVMVAVLVVVVLVILLFFFTTRSRVLQGELSACEGKGGVCIGVDSTGKPSDSTHPCPKSTLGTSAFDCGTSKLCCIGLAEECTNDAYCGGIAGSCVVYSNGKKYCNS